MAKLSIKTGLKLLGIEAKEIEDKILNSMGINDAIIAGSIDSEDEASSLDD